MGAVEEVVVEPMTAARTEAGGRATTRLRGREVGEERMASTMDARGVWWQGVPWTRRKMSPIAIPEELPGVTERTITGTAPPTEKPKPPDASRLRVRAWTVKERAWGKGRSARAPACCGVRTI